MNPLLQGQSAPNPLTALARSEVEV